MFRVLKFMQFVFIGEAPFAMIGESTYHKYYASRHPEVVVLEDHEKIFPRHFGIAVPKSNFVYLSKFNEAIKKWRQQNPNVWVNSIGDLDTINE